MAAGYNVALRNAQLDAITAAIGNAGLLRIYDGTRPATGGAATNKLAEFILGTPFAAAAAAGVLSPTLPANTTGLLVGTATWFRVVTAGGTQEIDGSVGSELTLNTTTVSVGVTMSVTSWSISRGNA